MSIRTNKMKAVPLLLKQLMTTRKKFHERGRDETFDKKLEKLRLELSRIKDVFVEVKKNEEKLLDTLAEVYGNLRKLDRGKLDQDMNDICQRIRDCVRKLVPMQAFDDSSKEEDHKDGEKVHSSQESWQAHQYIHYLDYYYSPDYPLKACLLSLLVFPENAVIRKRIAINMWIGEGFVQNTENKTTEEWAEDVIEYLLRLNVIVAYGKGKGPLANKFQILPSVRHQMESYLSKENVDHQGQYFIRKVHPKNITKRLELEGKKVKLGGEDWDFGDRTIRTIFNISASYLNFRLPWLTELKNIEVLQLGRWQDSPTHHIEVGSEEFLKELIKLKQLKYLSLRGISRIFKLSSSIAELESLVILDLKACHNLETLPDDISSMKSLTHLIMSDCCLLEGMPKGIEKLTNLQVLKGFLITTSEKTPCRISDFVNLRKLRQLSINIGSEAVIREGEFESLGSFLALKHLKISWSVSNPRYAKISVVLPIGLRKLHLECFPGKSLVELFMPGVLEVFDFTLEIKITGGKLESMNIGEIGCNVETLHLNYLKQFHF